ncbi:hypothetical protein V3C99_002973 [Haemonchus contortus]
MSNIYSNKQVAAVEELLNAFAVSDSSLLESAACLFSHNNMSPGPAGKDVAKFTSKMKTRDPRFASVFTRTIDVLRASPSIENVDALMEVLIKCRMRHVWYTKSRRERAETRSEMPRSPFFNRRSASRGKLSRIERGEQHNSTVDLIRDSPQVSASQEIRATPQISARNPLFSVGLSPSPYHRSDVASCNGPSHLKPVDSKPHAGTLAARMGTTASVPERTLCIELCGALQGLEGTYFRKDPHGYLRVTKSCSLSQAQRLTIESALSIAHLYTDIARVPPNHSDDLLSQAFLLESQTILEEYIHDVGDIPINCRPLTVLRILSAIENWRDRLTILQRLYNLRNEPGTRLMEMIYTVHSFVRENFVVDKVLYSCAGVLCRSICRWMSGFELEECDSQMINSCSTHGYRLVWIPPFFPRWIAEYILKIGKSWRSVDLRKSSENLDKARAVVASQLNSKCLYVQSERPKLEFVVQEVCSLVCGSVVRSLVVDHHLLEHFDAAHCFLLLHDAQFSLSLYRQFCQYSHGLRSKLSKRDANNALIAAAASSTTARRFPFQLCLDALPSLDDSPNTSSRLQFVQPLRPLYRPKGPVGDIFRNTEKRYEALFHFIWPLEMSLLMISDRANAIRQTVARISRKIGNEFVKSLRLTSTLLSCCERVLLGFRIYIVEVVDQFFKRLRLWIDDAIDLDAIVEAHDNYLNGLSGAFFLKDEQEDIYGLIMSVLQIAHELSQHCLDIDKQVETALKKPRKEGGGDLSHVKATYLLVTQAKLQKIFLELYSRIKDLNKQQNSSAFNILLGILK